MRIVTAILLFALLAPALAPLATLASREGAAPDSFCALDKEECMEGDRCMLKERGGKECRMHGGKHGSVHEGHGPHHKGHDDKPHCATFYRCGTDGADAFSVNVLETPFLISSNPFRTAFSGSPLFKGVEPLYRGPFTALPERPPSAFLSV
ncbi:MAG: hypothetical protein Q8P48_08290 [Deltaproteobacteria bacterium]|nr:hypothetical protein [Deltaproteobacteria bacterium]